MAEIPPDTVGSLEDAARVAGVSSETLKKWIARGEFAPGEVVKLQAVRGRGNTYAINLAAAARLGASHWAPPHYSPPPPTLPALHSERERPRRSARSP